MNHKPMRRVRKKLARRKIHAFIAVLVLFGFILPTWQRNLARQFGYRRERVERHHREVSAEHTWLRSVVSRAGSSGELHRKIEEMEIPLVEPGEWNIYYLDTAEAGETGAPPLVIITPEEEDEDRPETRERR